MERLALIGLGPHSKRIYVPLIEEHSEKKKLDFVLLIEQIGKKSEVENFFRNRKYRPQKIVYVPDVNLNGDESLPKDIQKFILEKNKELKISKVIIGTEPRAHYPYIDLFLDTDADILVDKPIVAIKDLISNPESSDNLLKLVESIKDRVQKRSKRVYVQVQRREHEAYQHIFQLANSIVEEYKVPITYFHMYHCDGSWNMPNEFWSRENHPYKYGYGKLMHSGYHFIDIAAQIFQINKQIFKNSLFEVSSRMLLPQENFDQLGGSEFYQKMFGQKVKFPSFRNYGELDSFVFIQQVSEDNKVISTGGLDLLQSGFSKRAWFELPVDTYKGNGRLRHESLNMQIGPLCNIQFHSYQSNEVGKSEIDGIGAEDHLDVYIFRNSQLIGGKDFEKIQFGKKIKERDGDSKSYLGQNETARRSIFEKFIDGISSSCEIQNQIDTNLILASTYKSYCENKKITRELD